MIPTPVAFTFLLLLLFLLDRHPRVPAIEPEYEYRRNA
jgi:hypothetical protein